MRSFYFQHSLIFLGLISNAPVWARPGNAERYPIGASTAGMGGAGIAHATSVWHNPAGLGRVNPQGLSASVSVYDYTRERAKNIIDLDLGGRVHGHLKNDSIDLFPANLDYVKPMGTTGPIRHGIGLSIVIPDFDQFDGTFEAPPDEVVLAMNIRRVADTQTFWVIPGWGACYTRTTCDPQIPSTGPKN
ncbi:MAG: hypothetical protein R3C68_16825 [Myxococcota bacterium]